MVLEDNLQDLVRAVLELVDDTVVQGILVLLQPGSDVVGDSAGVVHNGKVGAATSLLVRLGSLEVGVLAQMVSLQLLLKGLVGGLGEHRLFLEDGQDTHGL